MVRAKRSLGQNFLVDPNLQRRIVEALEAGPADEVLEIGPGTGALTRHLAGEVRRPLGAIGLDDRLGELRRKELGGRPGFEIVHANALDLDPAELVEDFAAAKVIGNIPYNITTPLIFWLLERDPRPERIVLMIQKEVADRLVAAPGSSDYGLPSVVVAFTARVVERFTVPPQVFVPPPQVSSGVLRLDRVEPPPGFETALSLARRAFGQRRKMLRRSLEGVVTEDAFAAAGVSGESRPETLSAAEFLALAKEVSDG